MSACELCGEPMPPGEEMFKYHGYSGPCPKPPLPAASAPAGPPTQPETGNCRFGGSVRTTPFYLVGDQRAPEYDQGDSVIVWYDDLFNLAETAVRLSEVEAENHRLKVDVARQEAKGYALEAANASLNRKLLETDALWQEALAELETLRSAIRWALEPGVFFAGHTGEPTSWRAELRRRAGMGKET